MRSLLIVLAALTSSCHQDEKPSENLGASKGTSAPAAGASAQAAKANTPATDSDDAYLRDIDRFCYAEKHADALDIETTARSLVVADWLGRNLETVRARDFLISLQSLTPADKAKRLRAEGAKAKLEDCPTAAAWEKLSAESSR